jgi:hypothetical protein
MPYKNREDLYAAQKRHRIKKYEFLLTQQCIECGEKDPVVLEFNHRNQKTKLKEISNMLSGHYSWETIYKEVKKCDIRCANGHRRKTYRQFDFFGKSKPL